MRYSAKEIARIEFLDMLSANAMESLRYGFPEAEEAITWLGDRYDPNGEDWLQMYDAVMEDAKVASLEELYQLIKDIPFGLLHSDLYRLYKKRCEEA